MARRKPPTLQRIVVQILDRRVPVSGRGHIKKLPVRQLILEQMRALAEAGDKGALDRVLRFYEECRDGRERRRREHEEWLKRQGIKT